MVTVYSRYVQYVTHTVLNTKLTAYMLLSVKCPSSHFQSQVCPVPTLPLKVQPIALEPPCSQLAALYLDCLGSSMTSATLPTNGEASYQGSAEAMMMEDNCYKVVVVSCSVCQASANVLCNATAFTQTFVHTHTHLLTQTRIHTQTPPAHLCSLVQRRLSPLSCWTFKLT